VRLFLRVIGFCGLPGSGKSTAIKSVEDLGVIINMGDVVRNEAIKKKIELNDENLGQIAKDLRREGGNDIIAEKCVDLINNSQSEVVFVDGIRSPYELDVFRKYWKFPLVVIEAREDIRHKRILERARDDDSNSIVNIQNRDEREIAFGLIDLIGKAEYIIENNSSIKHLKKSTRKLINNLIKKYYTV
jgi:dephospho-CoA kinase